MTPESNSGVSETSGTTFSLAKNLYLTPLYLFMASYYHLRNAFTICDDKRLIGEVDKNHAHLTTIVGINCTWRIEHSNTLLYCKSATRSHLSLKTRRKSKKKSCRYKYTLQWLQFYRLVKVCPQIHTC